MIESDIFRALADPTRRAVYQRLAAAELSVSDLRGNLPVSQPAISQHLGVLRAAGLVIERREGRFAYYRAAPDGLSPLLDWIERYSAYWPERIEKLKDVLKDI